MITLHLRSRYSYGKSVRLRSVSVGVCLAQAAEEVPDVCNEGARDGACCLLYDTDGHSVRFLVRRYLEVLLVLVHDDSKWLAPVATCHRWQVAVHETACPLTMTKEGLFWTRHCPGPNAPTSACTWRSVNPVPDSFCHLPLPLSCNVQSVTAWKLLTFRTLIRKIPSASSIA